MNYSKLTSPKSLLVVSVCLILVMIVSGCKGFRIGNAFLEKPASKGITQDSVFTSPVKARKFLWHAYETLYYGLPVAGPYDTDVLYGDILACLTDINASFNNNGGHREYYPGTITAGTASEPFISKHYIYNFYDSGAWVGIREAYIFINHVDEVPKMVEPVEERLKAEARMIIAFQYARLFRNYGGMFWISHYYKPPIKSVQLPRLTAKATLDSIVTMIDRAIPHLPFKLDNPKTGAGRFTAAGAMALKCNVLLFGASPLFNSDKPYKSGLASTKKLVWYGGYDPSMWKRAADACHDFIIANQKHGMPYHLSKVTSDNPTTADYRKAFQHGYYDRDSPELLIQTRKGATANGFPEALVNKGHYNPTDNYVKMFPMADGTPIDKSGSGYDPTHPYQNRDPRLYETVLVNGDTYRNRKAQLWIGGRERKSAAAVNARLGYQGRKFVLDVNNTNGNFVQWPYLRLPEIYFDYAEAVSEVHGHPTPEAYKYVNKVRHRVGLDDLQNSMKDPQSEKEFIKRLLTARVLELGFENVRWYDMTRRKLKNVFTKTLYGMNICKKGTPAARGGVCADNGVGYHESNKFIYSRFKVSTIQTRSWAINFSPNGI